MYTNSEYADMFLTLGECRNNATAAARMYAERYPERHHPNKDVFRRLEQRARETGSFWSGGIDRGRPRTVRTPAVEEAVLNLLEVNPRRSTRSIAQELQLHRSLVWNVVHRERYHPFHYTRVQVLRPEDYLRRQNFCNWLFAQIDNEPNFTYRILWTDECTFSRDGVFNHNHYYSVENPHVIYEGNHQQRFSVNLWAGILGNYLLGPVITPNRLNGENFYEFLQNDLQDLLENLPLLPWANNTWFQLDGCPAHFAGPVRAWIDENYPNRWIGRGGPVAWPARSPDLTPLDFFFWGHIKDSVYTTPVENRQDLINRIRIATNTVDANMLGRVQFNIIRRARACLDAGGRHFEQLL